MNDSTLADGEWTAPAEAPALTVPHWASWGAAFLALLAATLWLAAAAKSLQRPVQAVVVRGALAHLHATDVAGAAGITLGTSWKAVDLGHVRDSLEAMPWVSQARVSRQWPDTLIVSVVERTPFARWGDHEMIDTSGQLFQPATQELPQDLPRLAGASGHEQEVMDAFTQLAHSLGSTPFAIDGLSQDARGDWVGACRSGLLIHFGTGSPNDKVAMLTGAVARTLAGKLDQVSYIDLRYTNGFAVGWKTPPDTSRTNNQGASP